MIAYGLMSLVEATGIEPHVSTDSFDALIDQKPCKTITPDEVMQTLIDTFLHRICEIYAKWSELPPALQKSIRNWDSLPEHVRMRIQELLKPPNND